MHGIPRKSINDQTLHMFVSLLSWGNQVISDPLMSPSSHLADRSDTYPISFFWASKIKDRRSTPILKSKAFHAKSWGQHMPKASFSVDGWDLGTRWAPYHL